LGRPVKDANATHALAKARRRASGRYESATASGHSIRDNERCFIGQTRRSRLPHCGLSATTGFAGSRIVAVSGVRGGGDSPSLSACMSTQSDKALECAGEEVDVIKLFVNGQSPEFELTDDVPMLRLSTKGSRA
jgi:hypothetical protein